jgi:hypothetical protein
MNTAKKKENVRINPTGTTMRRNLMINNTERLIG